MVALDLLFRGGGGGGGTLNRTRDTGLVKDNGIIEHCGHVLNGRGVPLVQRLVKALCLVEHVTQIRYSGDVPGFQGLVAAARLPTT